jgi:hypothetical protein
MASIIIVANGAAEESVNQSISLARSMDESGTSNEIILVSEKPLSGFEAGRNFVATQDKPMSAALNIAAACAKSEKLLFMDANAIMSQAKMRKFMDMLDDRRQNGILVVPMKVGGKSMEMAPFTIDAIVRAVTHHMIWPGMMIGVSTDFIRQIQGLQGNSMKESMARMIVAAISEGLQVSDFESQAELRSGASEKELIALSNDETARTLESAVSMCNIEDLFPNFAWAEFQEESAAAAFHTLAALFVKYGANQAAMDCLSMGDRFEDSPRSLAIKGLIAMHQGEMLGAVANMVSSLKQYEIRKAKNGHYLSFTPSNIEAMNTSLHAGLSALNKQDNPAALEHFASAVFQFDKFYHDCGIDSVKAPIH